MKHIMEEQKMNRSEEARSELKGLYEEWSKQKEIVDRLKERIEEIKKDEISFYIPTDHEMVSYTDGVLNELQIILEGEK